VARGLQRPVVYASVSTMNENILPVLSQAGIARANVRLWSAHYEAGEHICGPSSCGLLSVDADGTQWSDNALGLVLDQSLLADDFFTTTMNTIVTEAELQSGQLNNGHGVFTVIPVPLGNASQVSFALDNHAQNVPTASLRVAIFDTAWHVQSDVVLDGNKGLQTIAFPNAAKTGVVSVRRNDAGNLAFVYVIYYPVRKNQTPAEAASSLVACLPRARAWGNSGHLAGVLLDQRAEVRQRGLDVLASAPAHQLVRLDDRGPARVGGHVVGHGEQRLGHGVAVLGQVVTEVGTTRRLEASPVRLELVDDARQDGRDRLLVVTGGKRRDSLVGGLQRGSGDALVGELVLDERLGVGDEVRGVLRSENELLQRGQENLLRGCDRRTKLSGRYRTGQTGLGRAI
jgi:hypothetical protein